MKKLLTAVVAALLLTACNKNSDTYTINGSFNLPETYQMGDSVYTMGPITGYVYLIGLNGDAIDSVQIVDRTFTFTGLADANKPYFAYLVSEYAAGMFVIEPGTMEAVIGEPVVVTGTPSNDTITALMERVDEIGVQMYEELSALQSDSGDNLSDSQITPIYTKYSDMVNVMVEELYQKNTDNLVGVYCANVMTVQARSSQELEQLLTRFSQYVRDSELIQQHMSYLLEAEAQAN